MKEFIVYDKDNYLGEENSFYELDELLDKGLSVHFEKNNGLVIIDYCGVGYHSSAKALNIETFDYIDKKDINGNKIHADCSIMRFYDPYHGANFKGYFVWCSKSFRYKIKILEGNGRFQAGFIYEMMKETRWSGLVEIFTKFEIIDTIQENKLKLMK